MFRILGLSLALTLALPSAAQAQSRDEQVEARKEMRAGRQLTLDEIHRRVVPQFERKGMEYITFEWDNSAILRRPAGGVGRCRRPHGARAAHPQVVCG